VRLTGGVLQFRDPLHVDDLGRLILLLHEKKIFGQKVHAGGGRRNILSLLELVRLANPDAKIDAASGGDYGFAFDTKKATRLTGWEPQVLIRQRIPIIADNLRRGITEPALVAE
jgi:nucleoside-diphosphate-sugar epimerase